MANAENQDLPAEQRASLEQITLEPQVQGEEKQTRIKCELERLAQWLRAFVDF